MKVETIKNISKAESARKAKGASSASFVDLLDGPNEAGTTEVIAALNNFNPLIGLQEYKDEKKEAKDYGNSMLNELNQLKLMIASSSISADKLIEIRNLMQNRKFTINDAHLKALIEEIEIRANVELLKFYKGNL